MTRFSGRKPFTREIFSRHVDEMRTLLRALELKESFEDDEFRPRTDIYETCSELIIEFDVPGIEPEALSLRMNGMTLILEAHKPREVHDGKFICVERSHGRFHHAIHLPEQIDLAAIRAEYRRGVLRVICPKGVERLVPIKEIPH